MGKPLTADTIMYGASLTKTVSATRVAQPAHEGRVDLDNPLAAYLQRPLSEYGNVDAYGNWGDLGGDQRWKAMPAGHVLTHSTGFANFAFLEPNRKLWIHFNPEFRPSRAVLGETGVLCRWEYPPEELVSLRQN